MKRTSTVLLIALALLFAGTAFGGSVPAGQQAISVNQLAAKPAAFLGPIVLEGRVAAVKPGTGLTLVDKLLCADCAGHCLSDPATRKLPVAWTGPAPAVGSLVLIRGTLAKTEQGYRLSGREVKSE
jgi:hypothetical protein